MWRRYDFQCTQCTHITEHWLQQAEPLNTCENCGETAKRVISAVPTQFKGFGFPGADDKWAREHEKAAKK